MPRFLSGSQVRRSCPRKHKHSTLSQLALGRYHGKAAETTAVQYTKTQLKTRERCETKGPAHLSRAPSVLDVRLGRLPQEVQAPGGRPSVSFVFHGEHPVLGGAGQGADAGRPPVEELSDLRRFVSCPELACSRCWKKRRSGRRSRRGRKVCQADRCRRDKMWWGEERARGLPAGNRSCKCLPSLPPHPGASSGRGCAPSCWLV